MNLPNAITMARLLLTAVMFVLLEFVPASAPGTAMNMAGRGETLAWISFGIFVFAAATDFVDGWVARRYGQVTAFGRVADPFVDKVLICGTLIVLLRFDACSPLLKGWMVALVVARELLVTTIRGFAESQGVAFPADRLGKLKMVVQSVTVAALLTMVAGATLWRPVAAIGVWLTILLTAWSGAAYVWKVRKLLPAA